MKKLMITAAASALILGAAACSNDDDVQMGDSTYGSETEQTVEADTAMDDQTAPQEVETVYLTSGQMSAGDLIGAEVIGADGEQIATVDDFLINDDGTIQSVIFRSGDFVDLVGTKGALTFDQLDLAVDDDNDLGFSVSMTEDAIQQVAEFEQEGLNDYRLASEMIGTTADFANSDESGRINDIIVTKDGKAVYAIVAGTVMMDDERQLPFDLVSVQTGDEDEIVINATPEEFAAMPIFEDDDDMNGAVDRESMTDWDDDTETEPMMEDDTQ